MKASTADEIIACLPRGRTLFQYFPDRYALLLLSWAAGTGVSVSRLRQGPWARLLEKPLVRELLARQGSGRVDSGLFAFHWQPGETFLLTLDVWNRRHRGCNQTSRGDANLVLQLNFNNSLVRRLPRIEELALRHWLICDEHPVLKPGEQAFYRDTLAWARLDLDLDTGEALIEEIQSDWLRNAERTLRWMRRGWMDRRATQDEIDAFENYCDQVLSPLRRCWAEIMLAATLWFIREELGLRNIWYHSAETGRRVKGINWSAPPRSLYTRLPRRFCFQTTTEAPAMLLGSRRFMRRYRKLSNPLWHHMELPSWP